MKKILCPIDFSMSSDRVSKYAAQLARDTKSKLILIAAHEGKLATTGGGENEDKTDAKEMLGEMHDLLKMNYNIACGIEEEVILGNVSKRLGEITDHYDLTVLAAQQKEDDELVNLAVDLIKIIKASLAPLLIVPQNFKYEKIKRLTYAYDYLHEPQPPLAQLMWLADWFGCEIRFVSILRDSSREEERKFESMERKIVKEWRGGLKISFETIAYNDVYKCLDHYIGLWPENNLLLLSINHQGILEKLWHKSVVKELLHCAKRPYMILHK